MVVKSQVDNLQPLFCEYKREPISTGIYRRLYLFSCFLSLVQTMTYKVASLILAFPLFTYAIELVKDFFISMMKTAPIPQHIGLIMDGNRRYAKSKDMALKDGHNAGADSLLQVSRAHIFIIWRSPNTNSDRS